LVHSFIHWLHAEISLQRHQVCSLSDAALHHMITD
jgi:hypothetical protein